MVFKCFIDYLTTLTKYFLNRITVSSCCYCCCCCWQWLVQCPIDFHRTHDL